MDLRNELGRFAARIFSALQAGIAPVGFEKIRSKDKSAFVFEIDHRVLFE